MAEQSIDFDASHATWQQARTHMEAVEAIVRMIVGRVSADLNGSELACDIELVGSLAIQELEKSHARMDDIERSLRGCRETMAGA